MRKLMLILLSVLIFPLVSCVNDNGDESTDIPGKGGHEVNMIGSFIDVIDPFSSVTFDYKNPRGSMVTIGLTSSYAYALNGPETYQICKLFEEVPFTIADNIVEIEQHDNLSNVIFLTVDYRYTSQQTIHQDSLTSVSFFIHQDGTLVFCNAIGVSYISKIDKANYDYIVDFLTTRK